MSLLPLQDDDMEATTSKEREQSWVWMGNLELSAGAAALKRPIIKYAKNQTVEVFNRKGKGGAPFGSGLKMSTTNG